MKRIAFGNWPVPGSTLTGIERAQFADRTIFVDGTDNAYMHLAQPSPFDEGDKVFTGPQIGVVGDTGDATA